jgi:hypothetical protein
MDKLIIKIAYILTVVIVLVGLLFTLLVAYYGKSIEADPAVRDRFLNPFFGLTFIVFALGVIAVILFPLFMGFKNPKKLLNILIFLVAFVIIGFLAYSLSANTFDAVKLQKLKTTAETSRMVGAGLIFTYFIGGLLVLAFIGTNVYNFFKR